MLLETERLILEPTVLQHANFLLKLVNTPDWIKYIGDRKVYDLKAAQAYAQKAIDCWDSKSGYGQYMMRLKKNQQLIGSCGIYKREGLDYPDVGFSILPEYMRQGYTYEGASVVMDQVLKTSNPECIQAITTTDNIGSQKLLKKLGLRHIGMVRLPEDTITLMKFAIDYT